MFSSSWGKTQKENQKIHKASQTDGLDDDDQVTKYFPPESGQGGAALPREVGGVSGENVGAGAALLPLPSSQQEYPSSIILFIVEKIGGVYSWIFKHRMSYMYSILLYK